MAALAQQRRPGVSLGARSAESILLGPCGPPWSGMESATAGLRDALLLLGPVIHVDTAVSHSNTTRGRLSVEKIHTLVGTRRAVRVAAESSGPSAVAHLPISQNVTGLIRDLTLARALRRPYIAHLHGGAYGEILRERGASSRLLRQLLESAAGIACLYKAQPAELTQAGIHVQSAVIGNALSSSWLTHARQRPVTNDDFGRGGPVFRLLVVGLLSPAKGFDVLCRAVAGMGDVRVTAIGEYLPRDVFRHGAGLPPQTELPPNVRHCAPVSPDRVRAAMALHDALILPSFSEGMPMTVLEAMSLGVPVIASNAGGLSDLLEGRVTGVITRVDVETVAVAIRRAIDGYAALVSEASVAREEIVTRFSPEAVAERTADFRKRLT